jgi:FKBP-type peptidyl-prolyl cis-trans isomerase FklB
MDDKARDSYCVGYQFGENLKASELEYNPEDIAKGLEDALKGNKPLLDAKERQFIIMEIGKRSMAAKQKKRDAEGTENMFTGQKFLEANGRKEGVVTLPSGLQYKVIKEGTGNLPKKEDMVTVHYRGTLIDGTEFDNSRSRNKPATFRVDGVIPGWTEALQLMKEGSVWQIFVPAKLAYGERGFGNRIPPGSTLVFDIELLKVEPEKN